MQELEIITDIRQRAGDDVKERRALLEANCDKLQRRNIPEFFSDEQKRELERDYVELSKKVADLEDELEREKTRLNGLMKPLKADRGYTLDMLKAGHVEVEKDVYTFHEHEQRRAYVYDENLNFIEARTMNPDECRTTVTIHNIARKTGTND